MPDTTYLDRTSVGPYVWTFPIALSRFSDWLWEIEPGTFIRHINGKGHGPFQGFRRSRDGAVWDGAGGSPIGQMVSP